MLAGADYTAAIGTLTFPTGTVTGATLNASVLLQNDVLSEDDETFKLTLNAPTAARLGTQTTTTVKILDDDPLRGVSIADATVTEPNGGLVNMTFKVALSAPVKPSLPAVGLTAAAATATEQPEASVILTVRLTTASGCPTRDAVSVSYGTGDATAHAGNDYVATAGTLTFPAGVRRHAAARPKPATRRDQCGEL